MKQEMQTRLARNRERRASRRARDFFTRDLTLPLPPAENRGRRFGALEPFFTQAQTREWISFYYSLSRAPSSRGDSSARREGAGCDDASRESEAACVRACDKRMKIPLMRSARDERTKRAPSGKMKVEMKRSNFSRAIFAPRCRAYTVVSEKVAMQIAASVIFGIRGKK